MRKALITGAASGIGRATALLLLDQDVSVLAVDIDEEGLENLTAQGAETLVADLARAEDRKRVVEAAGNARYLVNAAGVISVRPIREETAASWNRVFSVNAEAVFFLCQGLSEQMPEGGAIVNIASSAAKLASTTEIAIYAASKAAVLSITRSFARELAPGGIRVNAVSPGIVDTPMERQLLATVASLRGIGLEELTQQRNQSVPLQRPADPTEIASVINFLLSEASSYMTGQTLNVTGGQVTW